MVVLSIDIRTPKDDSALLIRSHCLESTAFIPTPPPTQTKMSLTIHHLQASQSERLPWLCEELQIPYTLTLHQRAPIFSPQSIRDLNPLGQAPVIQDGDLTLAESAACVEYIIHRHGSGKLALPPSHNDYADYLYWFHFANGTLQPNILVMVLQQQQQLSGSEPAPGSLAARRAHRFGKLLAHLDDRLVRNEWLAGEEFTAADIMTVFSLTTMRMFYPFDLSPYQAVLRYLQRVVKRDGYCKARSKADPELELMIEGKPPISFRERLQAESKI